MRRRPTAGLLVAALAALWLPAAASAGDWESAELSRMVASRLPSSLPGLGRYRPEAPPEEPAPEPAEEAPPAIPGFAPLPVGPPATAPAQSFHRSKTSDIRIPFVGPQFFLDAGHDEDEDEFEYDRPRVESWEGKDPSSVGVGFKF